MAATDKTGDGNGAPGVDWFAITPDDNSDLPIRPRALLVGVAGNIKMASISKNVEVLPVPAGYNPLRPVRVYSTSTTATGIFGLI